MAAGKNIVWYHGQARSSRDAAVPAGEISRGKRKQDHQAEKSSK